MDTATAGLGAGTTPIPDDDHGADLPLTMSASVVLTSLPRDAHQALADAEAVDTGKGRSIYAISLGLQGEHQKCIFDSIHIHPGFSFC